MKLLFLFSLSTIALTLDVLGSLIPPVPFPVFLKAGFSCVLEFEETPLRVVLGDGQNFQVEKVEKSIVIRTLSPYAASNMFVYFSQSEPRLFVLTASEDANPTYYRKFESLIHPKVVEGKTGNRQEPQQAASIQPDIKIGVRILRKEFDDKKDYLAIGFDISTDSTELIKPNWALIRITNNGSAIAPYKLWSERKEIQKNTRVAARLIFAKPNIPSSFEGVELIIPILGKADPLKVSLQGSVQ